jgi:cation transport ATPase
MLPQQQVEKIKNLQEKENRVVAIIGEGKIHYIPSKKIKQNLPISFAYNSITITIAAGLLFGFTNSPNLTSALAALGWIVSHSLVFGSSLLLRRFNT